VKIVSSLVLSLLFGSLLFAAGRPRLQSPIESISRELLSNFATGHFEAVTRDFNEELRQMVTPEVLARVKTDIESKAGTFLTVKESHEKLEGGFRVVELIARYTKYPVSVVVVFDALDRVGSVRFNPMLPDPPDPALTAVTREMLTNFVAGRFEEVTKPFHPDMRIRLTPEELSRMSSSVAQTFGTFQSAGDVRQSVERGYKILDLKVSYSKGLVDFSATFDMQGRVCALQIAPYRAN
jgi:hypothetical protein